MNTRFRGLERRAMREIEAQLSPSDIATHVIAFGRMDRALIGRVEVVFRCAHGYGTTHFSYADWTKWVLRTAGRAGALAEGCGRAVVRSARPRRGTLKGCMPHRKDPVHHFGALPHCFGAYVPFWCMDAPSWCIG